MGFFDSYKNSPLKYVLKETFKSQNIDEINQGVSQNENFLFYRRNELIKIYDRLCNHTVGKLYLKGENAYCPLHGWSLNLEKGNYNNASINKKPLMIFNTQELDSPIIEVPLKVEKLETLDFTEEKEFSIRFLNHACLLFNIKGGLTFASDPWVIGSAFCNGWWLQKESPIDVLDILNECDFIYISHNHPDHLHIPTLNKIRKDMPILTAGFKNFSTVSILKQLGFKDIEAMDFGSRFIKKNDEFSISVLKSGDFRDDSGLLVEIGKFKGLLTVDSNLLNFGRLPEVDLVCSSFAGGASGFPLCFTNNNEKKKKEIVSRNAKGIRLLNKKNIQLTRSKYFLPYAGFFTEKAKRDYYIKTNNVKNSIEDYINTCKENRCILLNLNKDQIFEFKGKKLISSYKDNSKKYVDKSPEEYLSRKSVLPSGEVSRLVINYFKNAKFKDNLTLDLITTDNDFMNYMERFEIDFKQNIFIEKNLKIDQKKEELRCLKSGNRYLRIKVRREELIGVIREYKPWEDLSIGFQCRIYRQPDTYNSDFWDYFTNTFISINATQNKN